MWAGQVGRFDSWPALWCSPRSCAPQLVGVPTLRRRRPLTARTLAEVLARVGKACFCRFRGRGCAGRRLRCASQSRRSIGAGVVRAAERGARPVVPVRDAMETMRTIDACPATRRTCSMAGEVSVAQAAEIVFCARARRRVVGARGGHGGLGRGAATQAREAPAGCARSRGVAREAARCSRVRALERRSGHDPIPRWFAACRGDAVHQPART